MAAPNGNHNHWKHGGSGTRLYFIWKTMRQRCNNPNNGKYKRYGKRGIKVCPEWDDYSNFKRWSMSNGYSEKLTIDRIDTNGDYEPSNCRWADDIQQANNKTSNVMINYKGEIMTMAEFCRKNNLKYKMFSKYRKLGIPIEELIKKTKVNTKFIVTVQKGKTMEDLKLKHIAGIIKINGRISIYEDDFGTSFCPTVADFNRCAESYVVGISASEGTLDIHIMNEI